MAEIPTDPAIPRSAFQGGSGKAEQGDPPIIPHRNIAERVADFGNGSQIMMGLHQLLEPDVFGVLNRPNDDLLKTQTCSLALSCTKQEPF